MTTYAAFHLLVVEDDNLVADSISLVLPKTWKMTHINSFEKVKTGPLGMHHAAFVDMHLMGSAKAAEGPAVIELLASKNPTTEIVAMSGDLSLELMESCLKKGATKFLAKPLLPDEVIGTLEKIEALWQLRNIETRNQQKGASWIGSSEMSDQVRRHIASFRGENGPILIEGETGTGKEVAFHLLNNQEPNRPTVMVNIAGLSENLFESEMYGHIRGAFTGADANKIGLAEAAHGGDLFLDEIEALPLSQQVKLLRFLESGEIRKVGAKEAHIVNVRVIAASNQPLSDLVKEGKFREDLLFRLSGKRLKLPPLRSRTGDIPELAKFFLGQQKPRNNKFFNEQALDSLKKHSWPGNVRELKRVCEQIALTAPLPVIRAEDIDRLFQINPSMINTSEPVDLSLGLATLSEHFEAHIIRTALLETSGDIEKTSELLKISRSSLYQKIKNHKIQSEEP
jgi:DNA-binding NtrC family response regulator